MSFSLPTNCPSCNSVLVWKGVDLACVNSDCGTTKVKSLASFLIKCGVEGVTETSLVNWGITGYRSMLAFKGTGKAQDSFVAELSKKVFSKPKEELFACMTYDGAGSTNIMKLINFYGMGDLEAATRYIYINNEVHDYPEGIGAKVITKIESSWKTNLYLLNFLLKDSRYNPVVKVVTAGSNKLAGKSFCITGTLSKPRKHFENLVTDNGGTLSSVSKKLSFLILGTDAGSKEDKAKSLGVTILTEDAFMGMI
jgi:DNA ligase (NAD+)